jgi:hypothetical protein
MHPLDGAGKAKQDACDRAPANAGGRLVAWLPGEVPGRFLSENSRLMEDVLRQNAADTQYRLSSKFFRIRF